MPNLKVKFASQYKDIQDESWKPRACSIASLWMALKTLRKDFKLTPDELLEEGLSINGYSYTGFWRHASIAILAHNHGLPAYIEEFKSEPFNKPTKYAKGLLNYGAEKIFNFLKNGQGLVIVSIPKNWTELNKPHAVLLTGVKVKNGEKYFLYNDSAKETEKAGAGQEIFIEDFKKSWRKLAIFIEKGITLK